MKGKFYNSFKTTRDKLKPNTMNGYISSVRNYLETVAQTTRSKKRKLSGITLLFCFVVVAEVSAERLEKRFE